MSQHQVTLKLVTRSDKAWASAFNLLSTVALDAGPHFDRIELISQDLEDIPDDGEIQEIHDENTMYKVYVAMRAHNLSEDKITDIITFMQNSGILFREIKKP